jgi:hypothetical protein
MILVRVRQRHDIDFLETPAPQIRRYRLLAGIDSASLLVARKSPERATSIDQ